MLENKGCVVDIFNLPSMFPTHKHEPRFWESLGRAVATFGFLEEILGKAIFAFTAKKPFSSEEDAMRAYENWLPTLERALNDQLWNLIESYGKAVRDHPAATRDSLDELVEQLKESAKLRNVICHGSWRTPNCEGGSVPLFVNRQKECFETPINVSFLSQLQNHVSELACLVINSVTTMGLQFPGSEGPGEAIW